MIDILSISNYIILTITFITSLYYAFNLINRNNPTLLKHALLKTSQTGDNYIYKWDLILIRNICLASLAFTFGMEVVYNLIIFMMIGKWYIEPSFTIVVIVIYGFFLVDKFVDFVINILTNPSSSSSDI